MLRYDLTGWLPWCKSREKYYSLVGTAYMIKTGLSQGYPKCAWIKLWCSLMHSKEPILSICLQSLYRELRLRLSITFTQHDCTSAYRCCHHVTQWPGSFYSKCWMSLTVPCANMSSLIIGNSLKNAHHLETLLRSSVFSIHATHVPMNFTRVIPFNPQKSHCIALLFTHRRL